MGRYLLLGATYAFAAVVQPGPLQAFLVSETLRRGWRRTLPAALAPMISDAPIIAMVLLVLTRLPAGVELALRLAGGLFLLYLAAGALRAWRTHGGGEPETEGSARTSLLKAVAVNFLNPSPYLGWSLVLGPLLLEGWREAPIRGVALVAGFYGTITVGLVANILLVAGAGRLGERLARALIGLSAIGLALFGAYQIGRGVAALLAS